MLVLTPHGHNLRIALTAIHLCYLEERRLAVRLVLLPQGPSLRASPAVEACWASLCLQRPWLPGNCWPLKTAFCIP